MSPAVDEHMAASGNNTGIEDGNVGQGMTPITTTFTYAFIVSITVQESHSTDNSASIRSGPTLYAKLVTCESSRKSVNFCTLIAPVGNGVDAAIHLESIRAISEEFANTAYSFFFGKWIAYLVVANYVRNTWSKYGRVKSMLNSLNGLFFFQFNSENGLEAMLENDPWSSYARAMIELRPDEELKDTIMVRPVSNKNDANNNGKKQQAEVSRIEVSNSNLFDALNSIDNDDDLDNDNDSYDDDLYDSPDMFDNLYDIYEEFDITVKFYRVLMMAFSEDGLSIIATKLGGSKIVIKDIINELAEEYIKHLECGKSKGTPSRSKSTTKPNSRYLYLRVTILLSDSAIVEVTLLCHLKPIEGLIKKGEDSYDDEDFDNYGLTDTQLKFANAFDISFRGQLR
ncbi:retrovirus-related pol polyprotein from transposon TNT 1-94 [Tanacetum coccineum]